ncbi:Signal transduction histidine kinase [Devosia crocina]|uniref:histidine kinase n=1 Tax=Devosia crocina TaxID=429728 RepID=A0A1I7NPT5_9HYPH|nr:HAMP domain-containing sensor histidine kinase [Devosia crocina]SFV36590.1 Signal transduction histidine kinase [Devosia crocina]
MAKPAPADHVPAAISAILLVLIWLFAFSAANLFNIFKSYSSIWFLPSGVILSVVLVAPGWLKLTPLLANLLLFFAPVRALFGVEIDNDLDPVIHGLRLFCVYGGAALLLRGPLRMRLPLRGLTDVEKLIGVALVAALVAMASGLGLHMLSGNLSWVEATDIAPDWWLGDALGAVLVPPLLIPLLTFWFAGRQAGGWRWPRPRVLLAQVVVVIAAAGLGVYGSREGLMFWYFLIPPPILFALYGGYVSAATAVALTALVAPLVLAILGVQPLSNLAPLLLTVACSALLIGAAIGERESNQKRLRALVASRTRALEEAHDLQRHLVRSLGHDLRQPVEAINLALEALVRRPNADNGQFLSRAQALGVEASSLVSSILDYSRLEVGAIKPLLKSFPLAQLMLRAEMLYRPIAESRGVELTLSYQDQEVFSDENLLFQVLSNHLDNAIRLSEPGDRVTVEAIAADGGLTLQVRDEIAGLPVTPTMSGLGLRIVERITTLLAAEPIYQKNCRGIHLKHPRKE